MSQNKLTTFIHNNLVVTIIASLVVGGGLSTLAFSAYNSGAKSLQSNTSSSLSSVSSSITSKSSLIVSSIVSSSIISPSSIEEPKKETVKETPKTVEVEKPKVVEVQTPKKEVSRDKYINGKIFNLSRIDGSLEECENRNHSKDGYPFENDRFDCDVFYLNDNDKKFETNDWSLFNKFRIIGNAKFQKSLNKDGSFGYYIFDKDAIVEPQIDDMTQNAPFVSDWIVGENTYDSSIPNATISLENTQVSFYRASSYEGGLFYDFTTDDSLVIRIPRSSYPNLNLNFTEKNYCLKDCQRFIISGTVQYSTFYNSDQIYKTYKEIYQGDVYIPLNNQILSIQKN